jgi:GH35 family endo-1,4-beta-xylanase
VKKLLSALSLCLMCLPLYGAYTFVDISGACNMGFRDEVAGDKKGGWTDQGPFQDLSSLPVSKTMFAGVEFKLINPDANGGKSCMMFNGAERDYFAKEASVRINKKAKYIYILHSAAWVPEEGVVDVGSVRINYADGASQPIAIRSGEHLRDWDFPDDLPNGKIGWTGISRWRYVGLYVSKLVNPSPEKEINRFTLKAGSGPVWGVLALSLSDKNVEPKTETVRITYDGMEPGAAWRAEAEKRIDELRKESLKVNVVDSAGNPVKDASVKVKMTRQEFGFGTCVNDRSLEGNSKDAVNYRKYLKEWFNIAVMENSLKWGSWEKNRERPIKSVDWLNANGIPVRGHNLVWPSWKYLPEGLEKLKNNPKQLKKRIEEHIKDEVTAMKGKVFAWDVINETYNNHDLMDILGKGICVEWFKLARKYDPAPVLFVNDYGILEDDKPHVDYYEQYIAGLLKDGAPVGGIGMQSHFYARLIPPKRLLELLDRFGRFGLEIDVTEYDAYLQGFVADREQLAADYMRDFMTAMFSHPAVKNILIWGFWEGAHWRPSTALIRRDWSLKPSGRMWEELVLKKWRTNASGQTDIKGEYAVRGFLGDYDITVEFKGKVKTIKSKLAKGSPTITVKLD